MPTIIIIISSAFPNASIRPTTTVSNGKTRSRALVLFFLNASIKATMPFIARSIPRTKRTIVAANQPRTRIAIPIMRLTAPPV